MKITLTLSSRSDLVGLMDMLSFYQPYSLNYKIMKRRILEQIHRKLSSTTGKVQK